MSLPTLFAYLPREKAIALCKYAEAAQPPAAPAAAPRKKNPLGAIIGGAAGMGVGMFAGAGAIHLGNELYKHLSGGQNIPLKYLAAAGPILGGAFGLAYSMAQAHQFEEMRSDHENPQHGPQQYGVSPAGRAP